MNQQDLEKHIRSQLLEHESPVDPGGLWEQIADQIPKKKKRRFFLWWVFLGAALFVALGWLGYQMANKTIDEPQTMVSTTIQAASEMPVNSENIVPESSTPTSEIETATVAEESTVPGRSESTTPTVIDNRRSSLSFAPEKATNVQTGLSTAELGKSVETLVEKTAETEITTPKDQPTLGALSNVERPLTDRFELPASISGIHAALSYPENWPLQLEAPKPFDPGTELLRRKKKTARWAIGLEGGISRPTRTLEAGDSLQDYRMLRQNSEEVLEAIQAGLQLHYELPFGLYFRTGLNYSRINEKFERSFTLTENDSIIGIQEIYIDANGDSSTVTGPIPLTRITSYKKRTYNSLTMLDIPLIAGYRIGAERWAFLVEGGAHFNLSLKSEGNIIAMDGETLIDLAAEDQQVFKTSLGLNYHLGLGVDYNITPQLSVGAKASFRFIPKDFTIDRYHLEQRYTLIGINLGLRYYLN